MIEKLSAKNMRTPLLLTICLLVSTTGLTQKRIDSTLAFQGDPAKKFSIYLPSGLKTNTDQALVVGLHPFNTNRWDAKSWCDTLVKFAEENQVILICPDGGNDGKVDDAIDTAFTTAILDSVMNWYTINDKRMYLMGFSWGGKTTYTYGLRNTGRFGGFMPIGATINGAGEISSIAANAKNQPFYVIHGSNDAKAFRFDPLVNSLNANQAILKTKVLPGVGHTIDFANRNAILTTAFKWLDSVNVNSSGVGLPSLSEGVSYLTVSERGLRITAELKGLQLYSPDGKLITQRWLMPENTTIDLPKVSGLVIAVLELPSGNVLRQKITLE